MQRPPRPRAEAARLAALQSLGVLDTPPEKRFDRITRLACRLFGVPIALVSLVDADRQWFKSRQGLEATQTDRDVSFCGHVVAGEETLVVGDATRDRRFCDNPLVTDDPSIRFYAGAPVRTEEGHALGTLCLIDREPRQLDPADRTLLEDLAALVETELRAHVVATTDSLTGLANRRGFDALGEHVLALSQRTERPTTLVYLDLDRFKALNDTCGHEAGDRALQDVAQLLVGAFRTSDVIARLGGDEFCVLTTGARPEQLQRPLAQLREGLDRRNQAEAGPDLAASVGVVAFEPAVHPSLASLVREADARMYLTKQERRRRRS